VKRALILAEGKLKDSGLRALCTDYFKRCGRTLSVEEREVRDLTALRAAIPERRTLVVLDERGKQLTSREFAALLRRWVEMPSMPVVFVIGGADGFDEELRAQADLVLALGRMTFAHRLVRVMLAEQLYRAVSILQGSPYHREG
jgi:23S rRNA (pseudouridine1915-N3)-methyltransferase